MYFLRVDYIYKGSPVQRERTIVSSYSHARHLLQRFCGEDYLVLQVKMERCV